LKRRSIRRQPDMLPRLDVKVIPEFYLPTPIFYLLF